MAGMLLPFDGCRTRQCVMLREHINNREGRSKTRWHVDISQKNSTKVGARLWTDTGDTRQRCR
jgi:hypothetical protein